MAGIETYSSGMQGMDDDETNLGKGMVASSIHTLTEMFHLGTITEDEHNRAKEKVEALGSAISKSFNLERSVARQIKSGKNSLLATKIAAEKREIFRSEEKSEVLRLKKEKELAQKKLAAAAENEQAHFKLIFKLEDESETLESQLEEIQKKNGDIIGPELIQVKEEVESLQKELDNLEKILESENRKREDCIEKQSSYQLRLEELNNLHEEKQEELKMASKEPFRLQKTSAVAKSAAENLLSDIAKLKVAVKKLEDEFARHKAIEFELSEEETEMRKCLQEQEDNLKQLQMEYDEISNEIESTKAELHILTNTKVEIELTKKALEVDKKRHFDKFSLLQAEQEQLKKTLKRKQQMMDAVKSIIPNIREQLKDAEQELKSYQAENESKRSEIIALKDEVTEMMATYLKCEEVEQDKKERYLKMTEEIKVNESEVNQWIAEESKQNKIIAMVTAQLELTQKEASTLLEKEKNMKREMKLKEITSLDLVKCLNESNTRLEECATMYEMVKNERNKYVNLINSSTQAMSEMRERIQLLKHEIETLNSENGLKDKLLTRERAANQEVTKERDKLREDTNKFQEKYRQLNENVQTQIFEVDKVNSIINKLERKMLELKKKHQLSIKTRDEAALTLIERNNTLCLLYGRSNIQEDTLKKGHLLYGKRQEEIRSLSLLIAEEKRKISARRKQMPIVPQLQDSIKELEKELEAERETASLLSRELERPENTDRWRKLEGRDLTAEELVEKLSQLEQRTFKEREKLLEKDLVLESLAKSCEELKSQAETNKRKYRGHARKVIDLQARIKEVTRKCMATASELSVYSSTSEKLEKELQQAEEELAQGKKRLKNGHPPSEAVLRDFERNRREKQQKQQEKEEAERERASLRFLPNSSVLTTAELRPSAYVEGDLGLSRPYGKLKPLKPYKTGANIRHIRKPQLPIIEME